MKLSVYEAKPSDIRIVIKSLIDFSVDKIIAKLPSINARDDAAFSEDS